MFDWFNSRYCACSNCGNDENICRTNSVCYRAIGVENCPSDGECFGCYPKEIKNFKCNLKSVQCCDESNFCNLNLTLKLHPENDLQRAHVDYLALNLVMIGIMLSMAFGGFIISFVYWYTKRNRSKSSKEKTALNNIRAKIKSSAINRKEIELNNNQPCQENYQCTSLDRSVTFMSTSTGSGQCELVQRTISRDIRIDYTRGVIGQGRFGCVWSAHWCNDPVAVKVFFSMHEHSWSRETEIYNTCMIRHENILGFIAADIAGNGYSVNMLLVTEYHENGSLYDYLRNNTLNKAQLYQFLYSICNGLNHLHQEIRSSSYKPSIAHRDLKSKNVLVKRNLECCLADFGLAVRYDSQLNRMDCGSYSSNGLKSREGSVRYMAPECLSEQINLKCIEDFKKADVYSYALIIWECLTRLRLSEMDTMVTEHMPPYFEHIHGDPECLKMKEIVCDRNIRPVTRFQVDGTNENDLKEMIVLMDECWMRNASGRHSALTIKKKLKKIFANAEKI